MLLETAIVIVLIIIRIRMSQFQKLTTNFQPQQDHHQQQQLIMTLNPKEEEHIYHNMNPDLYLQKLLFVIFTFQPIVCPT